MKTQTIIAAGLAFALSITTLSINAQSFDEPAVKILPTTQKGVMKIMYAYQTSQPVKVNFFNNETLIASDEVKGSFESGFSKKYDLRKMLSQDFWIEVTTDNMAVTYKMVESNDHQTFLPVLEKTVYNHPLVAKNN